MRSCSAFRKIWPVPKCGTGEDNGSGVSRAWSGPTSTRGAVGGTLLRRALWERSKSLRWPIGPR